MSRERLLAEIPEGLAVDLVRRLVQIPSHRGLERQETPVALELAGFLENHGLAPRLVEVRDGRLNLLCSVGDEGSGSHLLLCGHTDTVPLNENDLGVGFSAEIKDGRIHGRGAVDMKGALASMAVALVALKRCRLPGDGHVTLAAVIDEEMESLGVEHLIENGLSAGGAIVGEPTFNQICLGHKGLEWLQFEFIGRAAHGGTPGSGVNAIGGAGRFIELVRQRLIPQFAERADPLMGSPTLNFGTIEGGDQPSTVAARCVLTADRRSLPGESYHSICEELEELLVIVRTEMSGLEASIRRVPGGMATMDHVALKTAPDKPVVKAVAEARRAVCGHVGDLGAFPAWTDGALLSEFGRIPSIVLGPGDLAVAHSPEESIEIEQVVEAARLYAIAAVEFCGAR